jgi:ribosome-associated protein
MAGAGEHEGVRVNRGLVIPERELEWRFAAAGGPGGQHANTANTRVELVFDIEASSVLSEAERVRLVQVFGPRLRIVSAEGRSQWRNRQVARQRLAERLAEALRPRRTRRPTRPGRGAVERRIQEKKQQAAKKRERRYRPGHD